MGKCAAWQRSNPSTSVWVAVNEKAVPECTGQRQTDRRAVLRFRDTSGWAAGADRSSEKVRTAMQLFVEWRRSVRPDLVRT